jgi:CRISPR-associated protein Cas2
MYIVVSYDMEDDKRRGRIHRILKSFGQWVQYSVFECNLTRAQYLVLRDRLDDYITQNRHPMAITPVKSARNTVIAISLRR